MEISLPLKTNENINNTYVNIERENVIFNNFIVNTNVEYNSFDSITSSISSLTASLNSSNSSYFHVINNILFFNGFVNSLTSITSNTIGIIDIPKIKYDTSLKKNSINISSSLFSGYYFDDGYGHIKNSETFDAVGNVFYDMGVIVITSNVNNVQNAVLSLTSVSFESTVEITELNIFCKFNPEELNFTLNPTSFNLSDFGHYVNESFTASTRNAKFYSDIISSGTNWSPYYNSIGIYDDDNNLLIVGKFSQNIKKPTDIPGTIKLTIDL